MFQDEVQVTPQSTLFIMSLRGTEYPADGHLYLMPRVIIHAQLQSEFLIDFEIVLLLTASGFTAKVFSTGITSESVNL